MSDTDKVQELLEELEDDGDSFFSGGFWNNIIDLTLTTATVLASLAATGLAASGTKSLPAWLLPSLAGIPAAAAAIQKTVRVRDRSNWYFVYAAKVRALATRLKYAISPNIEQFANERAAIELLMEDDWGKIGSSGETGSGTHN